MHTPRPAAAALWRVAQRGRPSLRPQGSLTRSLPRRPTAALDPAASTAAGSPTSGQVIDLLANPAAHHSAIVFRSRPRTRSSTMSLPAGRIRDPREERDPRETYEQPAPSWPRSPSVDSDARSTRTTRPAVTNPRISGLTVRR